MDCKVRLVQEELTKHCPDMKFECDNVTLTVHYPDGNFVITHFKETVNKEDYCGMSAVSEIIHLVVSEHKFRTGQQDKRFYEPQT